MNASSPQGPQYDNPVSHILTNVLSVGKGPKNTAQYLWGSINSLLKGNIEPSVLEDMFEKGLDRDQIPRHGLSTRFLKRPLRQFLSTIDPYNIIPNIKKLERIEFGTERYKAFLGESTAGATESSKRLFSRLESASFVGAGGREVNPILLWDKNKNALFYGHESTRFVPVPMAEGRGVLGSARISRGYRRYSGQRLRASEGASFSAIELIQDFMSSARDPSDLMEKLSSRLGKVETGYIGSTGKDIRLGSLLEPGPIIRGMSSDFTQAAVGLREVIGFEGTKKISSTTLRKNRLGTFGAGSPIVFFDLETTGLSTAIDKTVEIGMVKVDPSTGKIIGRYREILNPERSLGESTNIHSITEADIVGKRTFAQASGDISAFIKGSRLSGYNIAEYDIPILQREFSSAVTDFVHEGVLDVKDLVDSNIKYSEWNGRELKRVFKGLTGKNLKGAHGAMADTVASYVIARRIVGEGGEAVLRSWLTGTPASKNAARKNSKLFRLIKQIEDATALQNIIIKSGAVLPGKGEISLSGMNATEALAHVKSIIDSYSGSLLQELKKQGVAEYYPFIKPEGFLGDKNLTLPYAYGVERVFGNIGITPEQYRKGLGQAFKVGALTPSQVERGGKKILPNYVYSPFAEEAAASGIPNMAFRGMPLKIGVMDLTPLQSRLLTQEGGLLLTEAGSRLLSQQLHLGHAVFGASDLYNIKNIEKLFGISLASQTKDVVNKRVPFNREDVSRAIDKKYSKDALSDIQKKLRKVLLVGGKKVGKRVINKRVHQYAGTLMAVAGQTLSTVESRGDRVILDFISNTDITPGAMELEIGWRRFTGIRPSEEHPLYEVTRSMGRKAHALISREEFFKMSPDIVMLDTFMSNINNVRNRKQVKQIVLDRLKGAEIRVMRALGMTKNIEKSAIHINNFAEAVATARELVQEWETSSDTQFKQLARHILEGRNSATPEEALTRMGIRGISIFTVTGGARSDFGHDIDIMRKQRITPNKLITMASGARLMGYQDIERSPVYGIFGAEFKKRFGNEAYIDPIDLRLRFSTNAAVRSASNQFLGIGETPKGNIYDITSEGLRARRTKGKAPVLLERIPQAIDFSHGVGGVKISALRKTLIGRGTNRSFIDLGKNVTIDLGGKLGERTIRYLPVPLGLVGLKKTEGGRLVVQKSHPAYKALKIINDLEAGTDPEKISGDIASYARQFYTSLVRRGKNRAGMFEKSLTLNIAASNRARLIPQRGNAFTAENFMLPDSVFDIHVGQDELDDFLMRRSSLDPKGIDRIKAQIDRESFAHVLLTADPTQRAEHQLLFKLRVGKTRTERRIGQFNISMHPIIFKLFERDTDRDAITAFWLNALEDSDPRALNEYIARQKERIRPMLEWHMYELQNQPQTSFLSETKKFLLRTGEAIGLSKENLGAFYSQKQQAPLGYTIKRAFEGWANTAAFGTTEEIAKMGMKPEASSLLAHFREGMSVRKMAMFDSVFGAVFQGGVQKGEEASLLGFAEKLVDIRQRALKEGWSIERIRAEGTSAVFPILEEQLKSGKRREAFTAAYLIGEAGEDKNAVQRVLRGLEEGLYRNYDETTKIAMNRMAELLGGESAVLYALQAGITSRPTNLKTLVEMSLDRDDPTRTVNQVASLISEGETSPGSIRELEEAIAEAKAPKAGLSSLLREMSSNKKAAIVGGIAGLGVLAIGGIAASSYSQEQSPLPPAIDSSQPVDFGPQIVDRGQTSRVYGSRPISVGRNVPYGGYRDYGELMQINGSTSFSNIKVNDRTKIIHPYSLEGQARRNMYSDF